MLRPIIRPSKQESGFVKHVLILLACMSAATHGNGAEHQPAVESELLRCEKLIPERLATLSALEQSSKRFAQTCAENARFRISVLQNLRHACANGCKVTPAAIKGCLEGVDHFLACASEDRDPFDGMGSATRAFRSVIDDEFLFYGVRLPKGFDPNQRYRLEVLLHSGGALIWRANWLHDFGPPVRMNGGSLPGDAITIVPCGRGNNSYKGMGRIAVIEAIRDAQKHYPIDEDRIMVGGASMGGTGAYALAAFYPDVFASGHSLTGSPIYNVPKGQGSLDPTCVMENLANTAFCQFLEPGDMEARLGRLWTEGLQKLSADHPGYYAHRSILDPKGSHGRIDPALVKDGMAWARSQRRPAWPKYVVLKAYTLRHNRAHWVSLDAMADAGTWAKVEARLATPRSIQVTTQNVRAFHLDLSHFPNGAEEIEVKIDESAPFRVPPTGERYFSKEESWKASPPPQESIAKRHALSGPAYDVFMGEPVMFVYGTAQGRSADEGEKLIDGVVQSFFGKADGGTTLHGKFRRCADTEVPTGNQHLVLVGRPETNHYLKKIADHLPVKFGPGAITLGDQQYSGELFMIYPNPENPRFYVLVVPEFFSDCPVNHLLTYGDYAIGRRVSGYGGFHFDVVAEGKFDTHWLPIPNLKRK